MKDKIKIDIVSDIVCPWCVIGYKRLEKAMKELKVEDKVEIHWQPFELNAGLEETGKNVYKHMSDRYGMSEDQVKQYQAQRTQDGKELGFEFNYYDTMNLINTRDAHVLLEFAKDFGKQTQLQLAFFKAHFTDKKNLADKDTLLEEVQKLGLDKDVASKKLNGEARQKIETKESYWHMKGVNSVPTMVINDKDMMNGAYPIETYKQVLKELLGIGL